MATRKNGNGSTLRPKSLRKGFIGYGSYMFKDKDPVIDELRSIIVQERGKLSNKVLTQIHVEGGPSVAAMSNWFFGDTMKPQNPSAEACGRSVGYHRVWEKMKASRPKR
jgi:hypothetical protein